MFWQSRKSDDEDMETAGSVVEIVASLSNRRMLKRFLARCIAINLLVWIVAIVFAGPVYRFMSVVLTSKIGVFVLAIPFGVGMFLAYCLFRLRFPAIEENRMLDSGLMGTLSYQRESTRHRLVWLFSVLGGVLNVLLLIAVNLFFAGEL